MDHDAAPWLDAEERRAFLALMSMAMRLEPTLDAQLRRDVGLTHFEYSVLANLSEADGGTRRMSELAWLSAGSLPRLSQVVTRLEKRGLVRREPDPDDGRYTRAVLTAAGRAAVVVVPLDPHGPHPTGVTTVMARRAELPGRR